MNESKLREARDRAELRSVLPSPYERRAIRRNAGISQDELGEIVDVSGVTVGRWEAGTHSPRGKNLDAYVRVLSQLACTPEVDGEECLSSPDAPVTTPPKTTPPQTPNPDVTDDDPQPTRNES